MKKILLTGGAGYIGSHLAVELIESGYGVIIVDNLSNSNQEVINRINKIIGKKVTFYNLDIKDQNKLGAVFKKHNIYAVIHLAGYKAVGESVDNPLSYYENNLVGTIRLLESMSLSKVYKVVFSSSATVYGSPIKLPIDEEHPLAPTNPYGHTKAMIEQVLIDLTNSSLPWQVSILRYFNPVGAHKSGLIGEDPKGIPNNLLPAIARVTKMKGQQLKVHGNDYDTIDGTGVRDYIHVVDLALGHLAAIKNLPKPGSYGLYNLGTGQGYSVLQVIKAYERASGIKVDYDIGPRREGDVAECYADPSKAQEELGWKASRNLDDACVDLWRWQNSND